MRFNMNRTELKEWFQRVRNAQQDENLGINRTRRRMLNETISPTIEQILSAIKNKKFEDPAEIASYLGAHEDDVADMMASDDFRDAEAEMRYSADDGPFAHTRAAGTATTDLKQTGQTSPEEYVFLEIIVAAWEAGVRWALGEPTLQSDRAAGDLEDSIMDAGLAIPPLSKKTVSDLEMLYRSLEQKKASGDYEDDFSRQIYGSDEEDEDTEEDDDPIRRMGFADYSQEYKDMVRSGKVYDK